jgi:diguanylate cyclase (GGDEF)-like protein/PAS domain S-box-containing protein
MFGLSGIPRREEGPPSVRSDAATLDVLVVEDSAPEALLTVAELQEAASGALEISHEISLATAMSSMSEHEPDVVLLDITLPDAVRSGAVRELHGRWPHVPIVVLTGNDEPALGDEVIAAGAAECLRKSSADGKEVLRALTGAVRRQHRAEIARLRESEARYAGAFEGAPVGMALMAPDGRLVKVNRSLADLVGVQRASLLGRPLTDLTHPDDLGIDAGEVLSLLRGEVLDYEVEKRLLHADGHAVWALVSCSLLRDEEGAPSHFVVHVEDIGERKRFEGRLQHLADHDSLTGLANRRRFERELSQHLARRTRYGGGGAVLLLDLDNFKDVNDTLGHSTGDELIRAVAAVLRDRLRESDLLARLGGDEFAILLPEASAAEADHVSRSLIEAVDGARLVVAGGRQVGATTSVGLRVLPANGDVTAEDVIAEADLAMYEAKEAGRNRVVHFHPGGDFQARSRERLRWLERLRHAIDENGFTLVCQPILDLRDDTVSQHELLVRMVEGETLVPPREFLDVAERFGLVRAIDRWVVSASIHAVAAAADEQGEPKVEINLSGESLTDPDLPALIEHEVAEAGISASSLIFEVTETALIANMEQARAFIERIGALGCGFALDDFGAGFGSFAYLKHLPVDILKIDGQFIRRLPHSRTDQLIVEGMVTTARGLGKRTIAEFVGDEETLDRLRALGVDYAQGFHVGRPSPIGGNLRQGELRAPPPRVL